MFSRVPTLVVMLAAACLFVACSEDRTSDAQTGPLIRGTHYTGGRFAPVMWGLLTRAQIGGDLAKIEADGFNTIVVPVPWVGFQPAMEPPGYDERHFALLARILDEAARRDIGVILRVGYEHDLSASPAVPHEERILRLSPGSPERAAWVDFLSRIHERFAKHPAYRFAFMSWEDFFLLNHMGGTPEARLRVARESGFQASLADRPLAEIAALYGQAFESTADVPVPAQGSDAVEIFSGFWDRWLLDIYRESRNALPGLGMEVRVDCEPAGTPVRFVCHDQTFDLPGGGPTVFYFNPAWGARNEGDQASADETARRFRYLVDKLRSHTANPLFLDQFNFVDNTPGFERNTRIAPAELPDFLREARPLIESSTIGYALWTLEDLPGNILARGGFEQGDRGWTVSGGEIVTSRGPSGKVLRLRAGGSAETSLDCTGWLRGEGRPTYTLEVAASAGSDRATIEIGVLRKTGGAAHRVQYRVAGSGSRQLRLTGIPSVECGDRIALRSIEGTVDLDDVMLFNFTQENGLYGVDGAHRPFRDAALSLNADPRQAATRARRLP